MQYQDGDTRDINGTVYVRQGGQWTPQAGATTAFAPISGGPRLPPPQTAPQAAQDIYQAEAGAFAPTTAAANAQRAQIEAAAAPRLTAAQIRKAELEAAAAERAASEGPRPTPLTQAQRNALLERQTLLDDFRVGVNELEGVYQAKFAGDKGSILGFGGERNVRSYLPWDKEGSTLVNTANSLVGTIAAAQGMTGGEMNSMAEMRARFGPMLPEATDTDEEIQRKIAGLRRMADAQGIAIGAQLGTPAPATPSAPQGMDLTRPQVSDPTTGLRRELGSGKTRIETDPVLKAASGRIGKMVADGVPASEIKEYIRSLGVDPADTNIDQALSYSKTKAYKQWQVKNPGKPYPIGESFYTKEVPQGLLRAGFSAAANSPFGTYAASAGQAVTGNRLDDLAGVLGGNPEQFRAGVAGLRSNNPISSLVGDVSGAGLAYMGGSAALGRAGALGAGRFVPQALQGARTQAVAGDLAYGAYSGSGDGDTLGGMAMNAAGGVAGRAAVGAAGRAIGGVRNETVRRMAEQGYPLTPGQVIGQSGRVGQFLQGVENRYAGTPVIGDFVGAQQRRGFEHMNRLAQGEVVDQFGPQGALDRAAAAARAGVDPAQDLGERALEVTSQVVGRGYTRALSRVSVARDLQFDTQLQQALQRGTAIPNGMGEQFDHIVNQQIGGLFDQQGRLTGPRLQASLQILAQARAAYDGVPMGNAMNQELRRVERAITGMVRRQSPGTMPALGQANAAYRRLSILQKAQGNAVADADGLITPAQLGRAVRDNTRQFGGRAESVSTRRPMNQLIEDARRVLPNRVPDSGTAGRLAQLGGSAVLVGGGAGLDATGVTDNSARNMALLGAGLAGAYTNTGSALIRNGLVARPELMRSAGETLRGRRARLFGGRLAAPMLSYYTTEEY